jgi:hypothetical protein
LSTWSTPQSLFDKLDAEFNFTVDVCATEQNRKCGTYFSPEVNGLAKADEIRFIRKKVPFTGDKKGVPFWGSVIVVFRRKGTRQKPLVSSWDQPRKVRA